LYVINFLFNIVKSKNMIKYRYTNLSKFEREFHEMILIEEIDMQSWYTITHSNVINEEIFMCIQ